MVAGSRSPHSSTVVPSSVLPRSGEANYGYDAWAPSAARRRAWARLQERRSLRRRRRRRLLAASGLAALAGALAFPPGRAAAPPAGEPCATVSACRAELAAVRAAVEWQRRERLRLRAHLRRVHAPTIRQAADLAGRAFSVSSWELVSVAACETGGTFDPYARNSGSGATGPWQFLPSTWRNTPFAAWSPTNPYAAALATAQIVRADGGWQQWECKP